MVHHDSLARLVGLAYDAAGSPDRWTLFLTELARAVGGTGMALLSHDTTAHFANVAAAVNVDPSYQREYEEYYSHVNVWMTKAGMKWEPGKVYPGQEICSDAEVEASEYYNDYLKRLDFFHAFGAMIRKDAEVLSMLTGFRPRRKGPFEHDLNAVVTPLMPHLQRALELHRRLAHLEAHCRAVSDLIDQLPTAMVLLDRRGRPVLVNQAARPILDRADGLHLSDSIEAARAVDNRALQRLIFRTTATNASRALDAGGGLKVERPSGARALHVLVSPLPRHNEWLIGERQAVAGLMIWDPEERLQPDTTRLAQFHGLTRTEAAVAVRLVAGERVEDIADALAITLNTARWHVKHVLAKAGVHSQAQFVTQVLTGPFGQTRRPNENRVALAGGAQV
jgi:DNA-binding CsgD family transcriptional regulator